MTKNTNAIKVLITGAAGQISCSLIPLIANGLVFGENQKVILHLMEITPVLKKLKGLHMEIEDGAYNLIESSLITDNIEEACKDIDYAILIGGYSVRGSFKNFERESLLSGNVPIFSNIGKSLDKNAKKTVKVIVVANPANTNALIAMKYAPSIPKKNFSALSRLDYNRAISLFARKFNVFSENVINIAVWGNHSRTMIGDVSMAKVNGKDLKKELNDDKFLKEEFNEFLRNRFYEIVEHRGVTSSVSAANSVKDHVRDLIMGTKDGIHVAMCVISDNNPYGIKEGLISSFPVTTKNGEWEFVKGYKFTEDMKKMITETENEMLKEKEKALEFCQKLS